MCRMAVIAYKSKYAHTKTYAKWIASEFGADFFESCKVKADELLNYDIIVYGGGVYNQSIEGISIITDNFELIKDKTIVVFTVGMECTPVSGELIPFIEKSFTDEMKEKIHVFHLKGESDYIKNSFVHKQLWTIFRKIITHRCPECIESDGKIVLSSYGNIIDFIDKHTLNPTLTSQ